MGVRTKSPEELRKSVSGFMQKMKTTETEPETENVAKDATVCSSVDNSNSDSIGTEVHVQAGQIDSVPAGAFFGIEKNDDGYTFRTFSSIDEARGVILAKLTDEVGPSSGQYTLHAVAEGSEGNEKIDFRTPTFERMSWSIEDSDPDAGTCKVKWSEGNVKFAQTKVADVPRPATQKGLSVEEQLYDTPLSWEFEDIFYAFLNCCYKLGVACEVNDIEPSPAQYTALIDEMAQLMKWVVVADADDDLAEDMFKSFLDRFTPQVIVGKQVRLHPLTRMGSDHKQETLDGLAAKFAEIGGSLPKPDTDDVQATMAALTKEAEEARAAQQVLQAKLGDITDLDAKILARKDELFKLEHQIPAEPEEKKPIPIEQFGLPTREDHIRTILSGDQETFLFAARNLYGVTISGN